MFAGIVEAKTELLEYTPSDLKAPSPARIKVKKPLNFADLNIGDSIAVNGICLTLEGQNEQVLQFALGAETLRVTGSALTQVGARVNLERSLRAHDRVHGHFVSGHVDGLARVNSVRDEAGSRLLSLAIEPRLTPFLWVKGSVAFNGVSLTINQVSDTTVEVCLIPETLLRTNLAELKVGDVVTVEVDPMARGLVSFMERFLENVAQGERRGYELHP